MNLLTHTPLISAIIRQRFASFYSICSYAQRHVAKSTLRSIFPSNGLFLQWFFLYYSSSFVVHLLSPVVAMCPAQFHFLWVIIVPSHPFITLQLPPCSFLLTHLHASLALNI